MVQVKFIEVGDVAVCLGVGEIGSAMVDDCEFSGDGLTFEELFQKRLGEWVE